MLQQSLHLDNWLFYAHKMRYEVKKSFASASVIELHITSRAEVRFDLHDHMLADCCRIRCRLSACTDWRHMVHWHSVDHHIKLRYWYLQGRHCAATQFIVRNDSMSTIHCSTHQQVPQVWTSVEMQLSHFLQLLARCRSWMQELLPSRRMLPQFATSSQNRLTAYCHDAIQTTLLFVTPLSTLFQNHRWR